MYCSAHPSHATPHWQNNLRLNAGGQWLASGSDDGTLRVWEVATGRCCCSWKLGESVVCVSWCPNPKLQLLAAAVGNNLLLLPVSMAGEEVEEAARQACQVRVFVVAGCAGIPDNVMPRATRQPRNIARLMAWSADIPWRVDGLVRMLYKVVVCAFMLQPVPGYALPLRYLHATL